MSRDIISMPWIRTYTRLLDEPRFNRMPDSAKWRYIQIGLLIGRLDTGGYLHDDTHILADDEIAWKLRIDPDMWKIDAEILINAGYLQHTDAGYELPDFAEEQGPTQEKKRETWRIRQQKHRAELSQSVTSDNYESHATRGEERKGEKEKMREEDPPPPTTGAAASPVNQSPKSQKTTADRTASNPGKSEGINLNSVCGYTHLTLQEISAAWSKYMDRIETDREYDMAIRTLLKPTAPIAVDNQTDQVLVTIHAKTTDAAGVLQDRFASTAERAMSGWTGTITPGFKIVFVNGSTK